jgi:hypothetical protein
MFALTRHSTSAKTTSRKSELQRVWRIQGYDSSTLIFEERFPVSQMSTAQVIELLRALASRHLTSSEIVGAYARRGTRIANDLVQVHKDRQDEKRRMVFMCGSNPYYVATPEDK